jgi:hypothetical protein
MSNQRAKIKPTTKQTIPNTVQGTSASANLHKNHSYIKNKKIMSNNQVADIDKLIHDSTPHLIQSEIRDVCTNIAEMLCEKNRKYGNSALNPVRIFSKSDNVEQLKVRIDDKISRIQSSQSDDTEDAELDLIGYLILLRIHRKYK